MEQLADATRDRTHLQRWVRALRRRGQLATGAADDQKTQRGANEVLERIWCQVMGRIHRHQADEQRKQTADDAEEQPLPKHESDARH